MDLEELQAEIAEASTCHSAIHDALDCAEGCETVEDFRANLAEAIDAAEQLVKDLKELAAR
jgi:hypothetical protein